MDFSMVQNRKEVLGKSRVWYSNSAAWAIWFMSDAPVAVKMKNVEFTESPMGTIVMQGPVSMLCTVKISFT